MRVCNRRLEADGRTYDQEDGDKLAGTMNWPDQKDAKLKDVKLKDGTLTFSAVRDFVFKKIPIDYKLTIDGDKLKGKGSSDFGGQKQELKINGKREENDNSRLAASKKLRVSWPNPFMASEIKKRERKRSDPTDH